ncbi:mitochondrial carrier domain-containing protein, partial [Russula compacta]
MHKEPTGDQHHHRLMSDSVSQGNANDKLDPTLDFLAGTAAGVSGLVVGFPFDTVKYRFQNPAPHVRYHSTLHALVTITREERLRGLFKGISSPLATAPLLNGLLFAAYRFFMKLQTRHDNDNGNDAPAPYQKAEPTLGQVLFAGAGCGLASTLLTTPIELIKIQQQKQQQHLSAPDVGRIPSARAVARHVYRAGGIRALYHGLSATIWRDVGGYGLYFYGVRYDPSPPFIQSLLNPFSPSLKYEGTLRLFTPRHHADSDADADPSQSDTHTTRPRPRPWAPLLIAGGAAGILGWIATFPFDVLKTRMQAQDIAVVAGAGASARPGKKG